MLAPILDKSARMSVPNPDARKAGMAILVLLLVVIVVVAFLYPPADYIPAAKWGAALETAGLSGMFLFWFVGMMCTSVGLPRQLVAFIGGLAYGLPLGLALSLAAALCGCWLTATVSRRLFSAAVLRRFPKPISMLDSLIKNDLFLKILVLRLQPLGTNLLTNVCIGFTKAPLPMFLLASAIGYVPQMLVFNLIGVGVRFESQQQLILSAVLLVISLVLGTVLYRRHVAASI